MRLVCIVVHDQNMTVVKEEGLALPDKIREVVSAQERRFRLA